MSDILDTLNDPAELQKELTKRGYKIKVSADAEEIPRLKLTEKDLEEPEALEEKINKHIELVVKQAKDAATSVAKQTKNDLQNESKEQELNTIRTFLKTKKYVNPDEQKDHQDVLDLMNYYYQKGETLDVSYTKACKASGKEPSDIGKEETPEEKLKRETAEKDKNKQKEHEDLTPKSFRSSETRTDKDPEDKSGTPKKPMSVRDAAIEAAKELDAQLAEEGKENPFKVD